MNTYTVKWYRGRQIDGAAETVQETGLEARGAYHAATEARLTPGCSLIGIIRDTDGASVTIRQLRAWSGSPWPAYIPRAKYPPSWEE